MNEALTEIADGEENARFMPPVPAAYHDHGAGRVEAVPLVSREFLLKCGTRALYAVLDALRVPGRLAARTKEDLVDLIVEHTRGGKADQARLFPPLIPSPPPTASEKRWRRAMKRQMRERRREGMEDGKWTMEEEEIGTL